MNVDSAAVLKRIYEIAATEFIPQATAILVLLAGGMLVYRSFRERYLLVWIQGWTAYLVYRFAVSTVTAPGSLWLHIGAAGFVLAVTFFGASVQYYIDRPKPLKVLAVFSVVALEAVLVKAVWLPTSETLNVVLFGMQVAIATTAALELAIFTAGRRAPGPYLFAGSLLLMPLIPILAGLSTTIELLLGLGMVVIVMEETRTRTNRLQVVHGIITAIAHSEDFSSMIATALAELKTLTGAQAVWFRTLEGDRLTLANYIGLTPEYARRNQVVGLKGGVLEEVIAGGVPEVVQAETQLAGKSPFSHMILIPVSGKTATIGTLGLGFRTSRAHTPGEVEFLRTTSHQLGIAVENVRMFEQMVRSQRQWANTFDSIEDSILVHDDGYRVLRVNRALLERLGRRMADALDRTCEQVLPGSHGEGWQGCPYCSRRVGIYGEAPDPCFGGFSLVSTSTYSEPEVERRGTVHIVKDITNERTAQEKYRLLFQQAQEGVYIATADGRLVDSNDAFARMLGYAGREEVLKLNLVRDVYGSPDQREAFVREMAQQNFVRNFQVTMRRKDGSRITVLETSFASRDAAGNVESYQGFLLDISEQKRAEEEIRRRNRELHALNTIAVVATQSLSLDEVLEVTLRQVVELFNADSGAVYLADVETRTLRRRAALGQRSDAGLGTQEIRLPGEFWERVMRSRTQVLTHMHLSHLPQSITDYVAAEGLRSWLWALLWTKDRIVGVIGVSSRTPREFTAPDENLMIAIGRQLATTIEKIRLYDETTRAYEDLRHTQEQLLQSEKMSAVGQLISGVAHELNNPLTAILGYAQLMENENISERVRDFVQKLYKQAQRTHRIVQNLLSFARQRKPQKQYVDLCRVLEDTLALREYDLRLNDVTVEVEFEAPLPGVIADSHQLEQVFLNIINNAVDAMLETGKGGALSGRVFLEGDFVCVEIQDSGPGMKDPKRVFDPFYTTKAVGKGTGLGLSICYGIVKEHGGDIIARNAERGGAVFQVRMPAVRNPAMRLEKRRRIKPQEGRMAGRVLLVDDEEALRDFEREVLIGAGLEVVALARGDEAIARLQRESFDACILDSAMPGAFGGVEIYQWLKENRAGAEQSVIITFSTDITDGKVRRFMQETSVRRVIKPFDVADLLTLLRSVLERARPVEAPRA